MMLNPRARLRRAARSSARGQLAATAQYFTRLFRLDDRIPESHLLRRMNVFVTLALADLHKRLEPHYSDIRRPSIDPELMVRMLIVGYCYGIRSERKLCQEVELHLAYRRFL
jgi:transposase